MPLKSIVAFFAVVQLGVVNTVHARDYIITLRDNAPLEQYQGLGLSDERIRDTKDPGIVGLTRALEMLHGIKAHGKIRGRIARGFTADLSDQQAQDLRRYPFVDIEEDSLLRIVAQTIPWGVTHVGGRVSSQLSGNGSGSVSGAVTVYVLDTGVGGPNGATDLNIVERKNFVPQQWEYDTKTLKWGVPGVVHDLHGHGTAVASLVGARDNSEGVVGLAPGVKIVSLRICNAIGVCPSSGTLAALDDAAQNNPAGAPAVINLSIGGTSQALHNAVIQMASEFVISVAAGNEGGPACNSSPASASPTAGVLSVAAVDSKNELAQWSNKPGKIAKETCVDLAAPGVAVQVLSLTGGVTAMSGTSFSSPLVAGAAALILSNQPGLTPAQVEGLLLADAVVIPPKKSKVKIERPLLILNVLRF